MIPSARQTFSVFFHYIQFDFHCEIGPEHDCHQVAITNMQPKSDKMLTRCAVSPSISSQNSHKGQLIVHVEIDCYQYWQIRIGIYAYG